MLSFYPFQFWFKVILCCYSRNRNWLSHTFCFRIICSSFRRKSMSRNVRRTSKLDEHKGFSDSRIPFFLDTRTSLIHSDFFNIIFWTKLFINWVVPENLNEIRWYQCVNYWYLYYQQYQFLIGGDDLLIDLLLTLVSHHQILLLVSKLLPYNVGSVHQELF